MIADSGEFLFGAAGGAITADALESSRNGHGSEAISGASTLEAIPGDLTGDLNGHERATVGNPPTNVTAAPEAADLAQRLDIACNEMKLAYAKADNGAKPANKDNPAFPEYQATMAEILVIARENSHQGLHALTAFQDRDVMSARRLLLSAALTKEGYKTAISATGQTFEGIVDELVSLDKHLLERGEDPQQYMQAHARTAVDTAVGEVIIGQEPEIDEPQMIEEPALLSKKQLRKIKKEALRQGRIVAAAYRKGQKTEHDKAKRSHMNALDTLIQQAYIANEAAIIGASIEKKVSNNNSDLRERDAVVGDTLAVLLGVTSENKMQILHQAAERHAYQRKLGRPLMYTLGERNQVEISNQVATQSLVPISSSTAKQSLGQRIKGFGRRIKNSIRKKDPFIEEHTNPDGTRVGDYVYDLPDSADFAENASPEQSAPDDVSDLPELVIPGSEPSDSTPPAPLEGIFIPSMERPVDPRTQKAQADKPTIEGVANVDSAPVIDVRVGAGAPKKRKESFDKPQQPPASKLPTREAPITEATVEQYEVGSEEWWSTASAKDQEEYARRLWSDLELDSSEARNIDPIKMGAWMLEEGIDPVKGAREDFAGLIADYLRS